MAGALQREDPNMTAVADPIVVQPSQPQTLDRAAVVATDADGSIVGRATLSRLYGLRAEIQLELASSDTVAIALIDALEQVARERRLLRLELAARSASRTTATALRHGRHVKDERRCGLPYLTWPTTPLSS
jgi:hypothetical protein